MGYNVSVTHIAGSLAPWLGHALLASCPVDKQLSRLLSSFAPTLDTLEALSQRVESCLFNAVFAQSQGSMCLLLDNGQRVHVLMEDLPTMADDVLYALFEALPVCPASFHLLNGYATSCQSLSALHALHVFYASYMTAEENAFLVHIIQSIYPPERYSWWLGRA